MQCCSLVPVCYHSQGRFLRVKEHKKMSEKRYKLLEKYIPRAKGMGPTYTQDYNSSGRMREQSKPEVGDKILVSPAEKIDFHVRVEQWEPEYILREICLAPDQDSFDGWSIGSNIKIPADALRSFYSD